MFQGPGLEVTVLDPIVIKDLVLEDPVPGSTQDPVPGSTQDPVPGSTQDPGMRPPVP